MQNAKYFGMMECKMQVEPKCRIYCLHEGLLRLFWAFFFGLLRPKSKMENNYFFAKKFAWCLVSFCKMMNQNPIFFGIEGELNTP